MTRSQHRFHIARSIASHFLRLSAIDPARVRQCFAPLLNRDLLLNSKRRPISVDIGQVARDWTKPVHNFFAVLLRAAEDESVSDADLARMLQAAADTLPKLRLNTAALQRAMDHSMASALVNGVAQGGARRANVIKNAAAPALTLLTSMPMAEAVDRLAAKSPLGSKLKSAEWRDVPVAIRERAWFSSQVEDVRFLQESKNLFGAFLNFTREDVMTPGGKETTALAVGSRADFVKRMQGFALSTGMGDLVPPEKRGGLEDITSERRLGLIFDIQQQSAMDYGNWRQGQDADVLDAFPAQRFIRVTPVKESRSEHAQYEGMVELKTNLQFWRAINTDFGVPWGPWGFGCGHDVEDVDRGEAEDLGLIKPGDVLQPAIEPLNKDLAAGVRDLDPDWRRYLVKQLGPRAELVGDSMEYQLSDAEAIPARGHRPDYDASAVRLQQQINGLEAELGTSPGTVRTAALQSKIKKLRAQLEEMA